MHFDETQERARLSDSATMIAAATSAHPSTANSTAPYPPDIMGEETSSRQRSSGYTGLGTGAVESPWSGPARAKSADGRLKPERSELDSHSKSYSNTNGLVRRAKGGEYSMAGAGMRERVERSSNADGGEGVSGHANGYPVAGLGMRERGGRGRQVQADQTRG